MEILHTYGGEVTGPNVFLAVLYGVLAVVCLCLLVFSIIKTETAPAALSTLSLVVCVTFSISAGSTTIDPVRHEVTLKPGHTIDATKYKLVEQRGKIYVIEEVSE